jgi:membrane-bound serine protease (ClpP class)
VDVIAVDIADFVRKIDGREVELSGVKTKLQLARAPVMRIEPDWRTRLLAIFSNPTLAVALLMIGFYGLFVEFTSPGFGVPGVAGTIAVLLGMYALQLLPLNWAGIGLLLLGSALMVAEVFLPSFGVLGVGGIVAFIFGGLMLVETTAPGFGVPLAVVVAMALISAAVFVGFGSFAMRARRRPVVSGRESLVGSIATVECLEDGITWVQLNGERWQARTAVPIGDAPQVHAGDRVRIVELDGLTLVIRPDHS